MVNSNFLGQDSETEASRESVQDLVPQRFLRYTIWEEVWESSGIWHFLIGFRPMRCDGGQWRRSSNPTVVLSDNAQDEKLPAASVHPAIFGIINSSMSV